MSGPVTVDIVVPAYAPATTLAGLVASVTAQTDPHWRLTLLDDAYPDPDLPAWARTLDDARIRYRRHPVNIGLNRNFGSCLDAAEEELVVLTGSDDLLGPEYVATVRQAHGRHPHAAMIQPGVEVVDSHGRRSTSLVDLAKKYLYAPSARSEVVLEGEALATSLLRGNWLYFPSLCWRTAAVRPHGFREDLPTLLDLATELAVVEDGGALVSTPTVCFRYRRHRASASGRSALDGSRFVEQDDFFAEAAARVARHGWTRAERAARLHLSSRLHAASLLPAALRARDCDAAGALVRHGLGRVPIRVRRPAARGGRP